MDNKNLSSKIGNKNTNVVSSRNDSIKDDTLSLWYDNLEIVKKFFEERPDYEQLCAEVGYILKKKIEQIGIKISSISYRAKELDSFLDKIKRKEYQDPISEITDFAGVRIVYLYT
jgi:putative GTP pyrophosphokinase